MIGPLTEIGNLQIGKGETARFEVESSLDLRMNVPQGECRSGARVSFGRSVDDRMDGPRGAGRRAEDPRPAWPAVKTPGSLETAVDGGKFQHG